MNRPYRRAALPALIAALCLFSVALPVSAGVSSELFVDDDAVYGANGCDGTGLAAFETIQDAVDAASVANTKIRVCPGTYVGSIVIGPDDPDGLVIRSAKPWKATVVPAPDHADFSSLIVIHGPERTKIAWMNIEVPTAEECGFVHAVFDVSEAPQTRLRSNHIRAIGTDTFGDCGYGRGISVVDSMDSLVAWNRIIDFTVAGIEIIQSNGAVVRGNTVRFNHAGESDIQNAVGIELNSSEHALIRRNVVGSLTSAGTTTPKLDAGIYSTSVNASLITANRVFRADRGITHEGSSAMTITNNRVRFAGTFGIGLLFDTVNSTVANNRVTLGEEEGMDVQSNSTGNQIHDNDFRGNGETDCRDTVEPPANTWTNNLGDESDPTGLCSPT